MRLPTKDAALVVVVLALIAAAAEAPGVIRLAHSSLTASHETPSQREVDAVEYGLMPDTFLAASRTIPRDATFSVAIGNDPPVTGGRQDAITNMFEYWLLPRRYTSDLASAQWIVTYHHSSETLDIPYTKEIVLGNDTNVIKVGK